MNTLTTLRSSRRALVGALLVSSGLATSVASTAHADADLPIRRVTLYRSGVGYFEHTGMVENSDTARLRFDTAELNDLLKSMIVFDYGGGQIGGVEYAPKEPLGAKLGRFSFNLEESTVGLLRQFRGEKISIRTPQGDIEGTILGAEQRMTTMGGGGDRPSSVVQDWFITLVTDQGVRAIAQTEILSFQLLDKELADELNRALLTVAEHRSDDLTEIELAFNGKGERRVAVAYTLEAPIWKTSYRLVLPEETGGRPTVQGWAIVENGTESDWENIELSLAAGRPISFTMDLQTPYHLARPNVGVPVISNIRPVLYESGLRQMPSASAPEEAKRSNEYRFSRDQAGRIEMEKSEMDLADAVGGAWAQNEPTAGDFNQHMAGSMAAAGEAGETFLYTLDMPVTIKRGGSSMLPILQADIEGRRVSIYQTHADHAMRGVDVTNDTGLHLMPGPIAVYDGGRYAGDSQIRHTSRNQDRLLSYAVDSELHITTEQSSTSRVQKLTIVNGFIRQESIARQTTTYTMKNHDSTRGRTVLIEQPKMAGWELKDTPEPAEVTDAANRFELELVSDEEEKFVVSYERVEYSSIGITDMPTRTLQLHLRNGRVSQAVVDAISKAAAMQAEINRLNTMLQELEQDRTRVFQDQERLRRNMGTVGQRSELWARYSAKLAEQETELEQILMNIDNAQEKRDATQRELDDYLMNLSVK
jgi:hypothetical protein